MKGNERRDFLENAISYTSPEIRMYETRKEIAELQNQGRIRAFLLGAAMCLLMLRLKLQKAISDLRNIHEKSSAERR